MGGESAWQLLLEEKQTKRVATMEGNGTEGETSTLVTGGPDLPALPAFAAQIGDNSTGSMGGQIGMIFQFNPQFGQRTGIFQDKSFFEKLAHLHLPGMGLPGYADPMHIEPGPQVRQQQNAPKKVKEIKKEWMSNRQYP
jgi:hypothetical protein